MRKTVEWFAKEMDKELDRNSYKGGWGGASIAYCFNRLLDEVDELKSQVYGDKLTDRSKQGIMEESIDVANFAMMIADKARRLP